MSENLVTILYVSESTLAPDIPALSVDRMLSAAVTKNDALSVTGGLIFTGQYFAQVLEGSRKVIDDLMASIERDRRHRNIRIIVRSEIAERRFPTWGLAYGGPSRFVSGHITRLIEEKTAVRSPRAANWLLEIVEEFSAIHATNAR